MEIPYYHIDAFTSEVFKGNPAGVCLLPEWLEDPLLQSIACENNLSETAFLVKKKEAYEIRWFTPLVEMGLCGHATLASAYVVMNEAAEDVGKVDFLSPRSGQLSVERDGSLFKMNFPARPAVRCDAPRELCQALGLTPVEVLEAEDYLAVFDTEEEVKNLAPDFEMLKRLGRRGVIVTAEGADCDFVSRFFAPKLGINEDPVTGSSHCTLIPYWREKLQQKRFHAKQISRRGGELFCEDLIDRVVISGRVVCYLKGTLFI